MLATPSSSKNSQENLPVMAVMTTMSKRGREDLSPKRKTVEGKSPLRGNSNEWMESTKTWMIGGALSKASSASPGSDLVLNTNVAMAIPQQGTPVPEVDWDAIVGRLGAIDMLVSISIQQIDSLSLTVDNELKRIDYDKQDLRYRCMQSTEESYKQNLARVGQQHAAFVHCLEAKNGIQQLTDSRQHAQLIAKEVAYAQSQYVSLCGLLKETKDQLIILQHKLNRAEFTDSESKAEMRRLRAVVEYFSSEKVSLVQDYDDQFSKLRAALQEARSQSLSAGLEVIQELHKLRVECDSKDEEISKLKRLLTKSMVQHHPAGCSADQDKGDTTPVVSDGADEKILSGIHAMLAQKAEDGMKRDADNAETLRDSEEPPQRCPQHGDAEYPGIALRGNEDIAKTVAETTLISTAVRGSRKLEVSFTDGFGVGSLCRGIENDGCKKDHEEAPEEEGYAPKCSYDESSPSE